MNIILNHVIMSRFEKDRESNQIIIPMKFLINLNLLHLETSVDLTDHSLRCIRKILRDQHDDDILGFYQLRWIFLQLQNEHFINYLIEESHLITEDYIKEFLISLEKWINNVLLVNSNGMMISNEKSILLQIFIEKLKILYHFMLKYDQKWSISKFPLILVER